MSRRASIAVLLLGVLFILPAIAHASPTDPVWIAGFYDDNDYDDVILFITGAVGAVESGVVVPTGLVVRCLGLIVATTSRPAWTRPLDCLATRAPPSLLA